MTIAPGSEPWCKASAVTPAIEASSADVVIVADADVWTEGLPQAVQAVAGGAPWAIPHTPVYRLTEAATRHYMAGEDFRKLPTTQRPYCGMAGGGYIIAPRETFLSVPMDPRFVGWGQEDESHAHALQTLAGRPWRGRSPLVHLYHPPQERMSRRWGSLESRALATRYRKARNYPDQMRKLIQEAQCSPISSLTMS